MATVTATFDVRATPEQVLDVIADLPRYSEWSTVHKRASIDTTSPSGRPLRATMLVSAAGLADEQTLDYEWSADRVSWSLIKSGQQRHQQGSYSITQAGNGSCHVRYDLSIDPLVPMPGFLVRKVMKKAVTAATDGLKQRVESLPV